MNGLYWGCGDCVDNDGDGAVDMEDSDCISPADNSEDLPGHHPQSHAPLGPCLEDCWLDDGATDDGCLWTRSCDPLEVPPNYYPEPTSGDLCAYDLGDPYPLAPGSCEALSAEQSEQCRDFCVPMLPNGCDCFGCCELPAGTGSYIWLNSTGLDGSDRCTEDQFTNPQVCHPCTPVPSCMNTCETCEICIGKPSLPLGCPSGQECPAGRAPCGLANQPPCPAGEYCGTGCCVVMPE